MKVITFYSVKGGTGKSTLCLLSARYLAMSGKSVLICDADPQASLTRIVLPDYSGKTLFNTVFDREPLPVVSVSDKISMTPSHLNLLKVLNCSQQLFKQAFEKLNFDYVLCDLPPTINPLVSAVLYATDKLVMPSQPSRFDLETVRFTVNEALAIKPEIELALIMNRVKNADHEKGDEKDYFEMFRQGFPGLMLKSKIPNSLLIRKYIDRDESLFYGNGKAKHEFTRHFETFLSELTGLNFQQELFKAG